MHVRQPDVLLCAAKSANFGSAEASRHLSKQISCCELADIQIFTFKTWGAVAPIITDQVHAGRAMCTGDAVALVCFQLTERPLESRQAEAGVVVLLVQADAVLRATVIHAVIDVLLAVDARESWRTDAAGKRLQKMS